jgi:hypothetical protein
MKISEIRKKYSRELRFISILLVFFLIFYFGIVILLTPLSIRFTLLDETNVLQWNKFTEVQYLNETYPKSNIIISSELARIRNYNDSESKLNEIFRWEMEDWHNPEWENATSYYYSPIYPTYLSYNNDPSKLLIQRSYQFTFLEPKNPKGQFYGDDPYWLAYNKVGACRELSTLFSYMAKESGIKSRTINTVWHQWVEVEIKNETYYYDPWCAGQYQYYNSSDGNFTFNYRWFNKTEHFEENCRPVSIPCWYNEGLPNIAPTGPYAMNYFKTYHDLFW